jgi:PAS domain S-box-containing protein
LAPWRDALSKALDSNGQLMVDLVPQLEFIIGKQPPVQPLEPQQARARFQLMFRRFISVFARPDHPLALFLDDLQWLDAATLDLLEYLLIRSDMQNLMLIGAYRDNEVTAAHPLMRKVGDIKTAGGKVAEIALEPLAREDFGRLIADTFRCELDRAVPLAHLVHEKTGGNPFFANQFIHALAEEGLLTLDHAAARWSWHLRRIQTKGYTDNVVDLMVKKLTRLPAETQEALQQFACLGNVAEITMLSIVLGTSEEEVHEALWPSVRQELVGRRSGAYRFVHDRIHEAAYSLIPEEQRVEMHLRIGRLLVARTTADKREEAVFDIVNQLNRGAPLITSQDEREQLAELNQLAGKRAKASAAYASALNYFVAGARQLPEDSWERRHELTFELELRRAECEFLTRAPVAAEQRLAALSQRAVSTLERAQVASLLVDVYYKLDQFGRAIAVSLDYLSDLGIDWSPHPTEEQARREYQRDLSQLGNRTIEEISDLPLMTDPVSLATIDVLIKVIPAAFLSDANLTLLIISRAVNMSLERGNCDGSCSAYVRLGMHAGARFGDYQAAYRFGRLGYDLIERRGLKRFQARTCMHFGNVILPMAEHVRAGRELLHSAFDDANKVGDLIYAAYYGVHATTNRFFAGDSLAEAQRGAEDGLAFAHNAQFGSAIDIISSQLGLIRTLRGLTAGFGSLNHDQFDETRIESRFSENQYLALWQFWYWIRKLQARFFAGDYVAGVEAASRAERLLWVSASFLEENEYYFYAALAKAAVSDLVAADARQDHVGAIAVHYRHLQLRAEACPDNFENRAALVGAEIARLEGRDSDAMRLYEQAIRSARDNGFVHNQAIAYERASAFYQARGFDQFAETYLRNARLCYLRWGADAKVRELDRLHSHIAEPQSAATRTTSIDTPVERLDLATVIKVSQAVSGEIVLGNLVKTLLRIAIEHAGAERGLLILFKVDEPQIAAEATTARGQLEVTLRQTAVSPADLPESVLHYVIRTRESVIVADTLTQNPFPADEYICQKHARSILFLPLVKQAELIGVLYLENNLASHVFTPSRISVLELLASQAAISLENASLYNDLQEREARIRRLVDANIIGIFIFSREGGIVEANHAFLKMVGYDREDLVAGRVRFTDLTPPQWRDRTAIARAELAMTGATQPFEKEYFRKDGSRVPVLIGSAAFDEQRDQGVAFVLDLTERKCAEEAFREVQMQLAHANRVATMGQLSASITHEVKQPIAAARNNARAALNFLDKDPPDLDEVREALGCIVGDADRAGDIVDRIRGLIKKAPPRKECLDINAGIREVIELTRSESIKNGISMQANLADGLPLIEGDRVQLQQVILNLIVNAVEAMSGASDGTRELLVSSRKADPGGVLVEVRDSGPGLAPETLEHVFDAFYTTKPGGLGMGLSICRSILDAHGGRLWASANLPHGASFQFALPAIANTAS